MYESLYMNGRILDLFYNYPELQYEDYVLRQPGKSDLSAICSICSDDFVGEITRIPTINNRKEAKSLIDNFYAKYVIKQRVDFVIYSEKIKETVGLFSIHNISFADDRCEIGFILDKKYRGMGIMQKVIAGIKKSMFNQYGFHKIIITVSESNDSCIRMCNKIKFDEKVKMKDHFFNRISRKYEDTFVMSLINN